MKDFKVIEVKRSIFEDNNADADKLRAELKSEGTFLLNLMSSPGAGKTTTLKTHDLHAQRRDEDWCHGSRY